MAENSYPWDSGPGSAITEGQWRFVALALNAVGAGVIPNQLNQLNVYALSDGRQVYVDTGRAGCFGHYYENTAAKVVALAANGTGAVRVDLIAIKFDFAANTATAIAITGSGSAPNIVQDISTQWTIPIGYVLVPNGAVTIRPQDTFACLDRFGAGVAAGLPLGAIVDSGVDFGPSRRGVPSGFIACDGAQYAQHQLPILCGIHSINGNQLPVLVPAVGASFDSGVFGSLYLAPDHRDRLRMGGINMGTTAGSRSTGYNASHNQQRGSSSLTQAQLAPHHHDLRGAAGNFLVTSDQGQGTYGTDAGSGFPLYQMSQSQEVGNGAPYIPAFAGVCTMMKVCG